MACQKETGRADGKSKEITVTCKLKFATSHRINMEIKQPMAAAWDIGQD